jgi:hypothetical protein
MSIFKTATGQFTIATLCPKCYGAGWQEVWMRNGSDGVCFKCLGRKTIARSKKTFDTLAEAQAHEAALDARAARHEAKRDAEAAAAFEAGRADREAAALVAAQAEEARLADLATYRHLDALIGQPVTVSGIVKTAVSIDGNYGVQMLVVIETPNREMVKMFTAANWAFNVDRDETITITGEVSGFGEYEGKAQTQVRKPKLAA